MSDLGDVTDRASDREEEIRSDGLAVIVRHNAELALQESAHECRICDEPIPEDRRLAVLGVQTCVDCQEEIENALAMRGL